MRLATSSDVLEDRPTEWPKPPQGFTTKRVLMPWHDFSGTRRKKRRKGGNDGGGRRGGGPQFEFDKGEKCAAYRQAYNAVLPKCAYRIEVATQRVIKVLIHKSRGERKS